ncbi:MAG: hypothetical protein AAGF71_11135 [Pseudomonadota bacterium]
MARGVVAGLVLGALVAVLVLAIAAIQIEMRKPVPFVVMDPPTTAFEFFSPRGVSDFDTVAGPGWSIAPVRVRDVPEARVTSIAIEEITDHGLTFDKVVAADMGQPDVAWDAPDGSGQTVPEPPQVTAPEVSARGEPLSADMLLRIISSQPALSADLSAPQTSPRGLLPLQPVAIPDQPLLMDPVEATIVRLPSFDYSSTVQTSSEDLDNVGTILEPVLVDIAELRPGLTGGAIIGPTVPQREVEALAQPMTKPAAALSVPWPGLFGVREMLQASGPQASEVAPRDGLAIVLRKERWDRRAVPPWVSAVAVLVDQWAAVPGADPSVVPVFGPDAGTAQAVAFASAVGRTDVAVAPLMWRARAGTLSQMGEILAATGSVGLVAEPLESMPLSDQFVPSYPTEALDQRLARVPLRLQRDGALILVVDDTAEAAQTIQTWLQGLGADAPPIIPLNATLSRLRQ